MDLKHFFQFQLDPEANHLAASQKVLENCGFLKIVKDKGFANARQTEIEEFIYKLT